MYPKPYGESTPSSDQIFCLVPEEDGDTAARHSGDETDDDEDALERDLGGVDGGEDAELEDERKADKRECIESCEEERGPSMTQLRHGKVRLVVRGATVFGDVPAVLVAKEGGREAGDDEQAAEDAEGGVDPGVEDEGVGCGCR